MSYVRAKITKKFLICNKKFSIWHNYPLLPHVIPESIETKLIEL